jgi:hypothetical protein
VNVPTDFFTVGTMITLSGATGATFVVCNGLQKAFNFNPRWLALAVAQLIVLVGVYSIGKRELLDYFVGVINGFLVFCSAAGATGVLAGGGGTAGNDAVARGPTDARRSAEPQLDRTRRRFLSSWF